MEILSKLKTRYLVLATAITFPLLSLSTFAKTQVAPDISEVLKAGNSGIGWQTATLGLFALSLATLSFAKGFELFTRRRDLTAGLKSNGEAEIVKEENSRLMFFNRNLQRENEDLKQSLANLTASLRDKAQQEEMLLKSANSLKKEYEKLAGEKERLALEISRQNQKQFLEPLDLKIGMPRMEKKAVVKSKKATAKPAAKKAKRRKK